MISQLIDKGYNINDPWDCVTIFENKLAEYSGSKYAVCVDSCSNALFLCLKYLNINNQIISLPRNTYSSVPMQCIHAGNKIRFEFREWSGSYYLSDTPIIDSACKFSKNMYVPNTYYCLSFHHRKILNIGKGGAICTDDENFVKWCRPMIYDGRHTNVNYKEDTFECIGYHMYMTPEDAATGLLKLEKLGPSNTNVGSHLTYPDLSKQNVFEPYLA